MRIGEAIRLDRDDLDFEHGLLTVHNSKFGKTRQVPLHSTTVQALRGYLRRTDCRRLAVNTPAVFVSTAGTRLDYNNVHATFRKLVCRAGLQPRSDLCRPRLHDLRHTFAVRTILAGYQTGDDVAARLPLASTWLGHVDPKATYWYLSAAPELLALAGQRRQTHLAGRGVSALAPTLQAFFTDRLIQQRQASPHTIAAYRDTLRLFLSFAGQRTGKLPSQLDIADLDAPLITAFLDHLERDRGNSVRTRNARLAAIHSLFRYAALRHPEHAGLIQRLLANTCEAVRPGAGHLPHRTRGRRAACRP